MQIDPVRIAKWRERAEKYRVSADASMSAGAQQAYRALAECADGVADRLMKGGPSPAERDAAAPEAGAAPAPAPAPATQKG